MAMAEHATRYAHTPAYKGGPYHLIKDHTRGVDNLATSFAEPIGLGSEASLASLLHDLGKYGTLFQKRLRGEASGIDHWTIGAWVALTRFRSVEVALAVEGHHVGIQSGDEDTLRSLARTLHAQEGRTLSESEPDLLLRCQSDDGVDLPAPTFLPRPRCGANNMLRTRMLFSTLV